MINSHQTLNILVNVHHLYSGTWNQITLVSSFCFSWEVPALSLLHINKGTRKRKRSTVCTLRYANCLLKNMPTNKTKMLSIKKSSILMSVSEIVLLYATIRVVKKKMCSFKDICIYIDHLFINQSWANCFLVNNEE